ncbi:hypothetical protein [Crocosphaera sp. XPORK-15E]|uniref:hypothetical protein n=1 Tax=Crocosphaera sp. XPORK-15E TaxID=3110247 RepID=UPI002B208CF9|nr:hypothetical protein [Crocosphaera sp. XPORK-15E]MEA5536941.1 hypothetical protein [Crocosphaera sp. XPORK-15E]
MNNKNTQSTKSLEKSQIIYPQVFYPPPLQSFLKQQQLIYPRYLKPQYPQSIWDFPVNKDTVKIIGSIGLLILGFVIVVQGLSLSATVSGLASWGGVTWGLWQFTRWWERRRKQHQLRFQPNYEAQLKQWQRAMKVRDRYLKNTNKHQQKQVEQRQQKLRDLLKGKVEQPMGDSNAPKGVSETMFLEVLKTVFPQIEFGGEFPIPGSRLCYSIDIAFVDENTGLSIDIEIDEPYEGKTKKPHHCLDDDKDRNRNRFFNDRNWVVIRFAEEQVVKNSHGCCRYLADVVVSLTQDESLLEKVKDLPTLEPIKAWTSSESKQMAVWRYRERYLQETGVYRQDNRESKKKIN